MPTTIGGFTFSGSALGAVIFFVIGWIISAIIIYVVTKLFQQSEGIGTAFLAALVGAIIYALAYFFLGSGLLAAVVAGLGWWIALALLYEMSGLRALAVAAVVWIVAIVVGWFLPTILGPL
jgi:hypothetical protein